MKNYNYCRQYFIHRLIRKVLTKISKESGGTALINWIRPCENHFLWSAMSTLSGNGNVIYAKFKFFLSHVINKHENLDEPLYARCNHGEIKHKIWLDKGECKFNTNQHTTVQCSPVILSLLGTRGKVQYNRGFSFL